jgi:hypothetical protein
VQFGDMFDANEQDYRSKISTSGSNNGDKKQKDGRFFRQVL